MVMPTLPAFLLRSATITPQFDGVGVVTAADRHRARAGLGDGGDQRLDQVAAGTPEASDAAATVPCPVSAAQSAMSLPGFAAIHWSALRPVSERRAPM